jgi:hypothetical protein
MKLVTHLFLLALALASSACTSFDRAWMISSPANLKPQGTVLGLPPRTIPQSPFDGRWSGRWTSDKHHNLKGEPEGGNLRIVLSKYDPYKYRADIRANFLVFKSDYETFLDAHQHGNTLHLHGESDGGIFGGAYHYDGHVTPRRFTMTYDSKYDRGTIELTR